MNFLSSAEMENRRDSCTLEPYAPDGERKGSCGRGDVRNDFNMSRGGLWENWRGQKTARLCVLDSSNDRRARFMHCEVGRMLGCLDSPCGVGEAGDGMECFVRLRLRSCIDKLLLRALGCSLRAKLGTTGVGARYSPPWQKSAEVREFRFSQSFAPTLFALQHPSLPPDCAQLAHHV